MWLSAIKLALNAGTHIYKKKQETKMAMADAQHMAATKMARGETEYQGKLLEARQNDYKDEVVLLILTLPILVLAYGVWSDDPAAMEKINLFFEHFQALPSWFTNLWILVCASIFGINASDISDCLWGLLGGSKCCCKDKRIFRAVSTASKLVYQSLDSCRSQHLWYKRYTNI